MIPPAPGWPATPTLEALLQDYDGFLLDAYGVLVDKTRALPGARELLARLDAAGRPWLVLSNAASRTPETLSREFATLGLDIPPGRLLTSGLLLTDWFADHGLVGAPCVILGPAGSAHYVERAGGALLPLPAIDDAAVLVLTDQQDVIFPDDLNLVISGLLRRLDGARRSPPALLLCNPDLIYPSGPGAFGITSGALAALIEAVLRDRYGSEAPAFERLGKPHRPLFDAGRARLGAQNPLMLGDQLATDIRGALAANMDAFLVGTGLAPTGDPKTWPVRPTWYAPSLADLLAGTPEVAGSAPRTG